MCAGISGRFIFTRYCYYFFHKPEIMVMDLNVHIGSVLVTHRASGESFLSLCVAQSSPGFQQLLSRQERLSVSYHWGSSRKLPPAVYQHKHHSICPQLFAPCVFRPAPSIPTFHPRGSCGLFPSPRSRAVCVPTLSAASESSRSQITENYNVIRGTKVLIQPQTVQTNRKGREFHLQKCFTSTTPE